ncbi:hypothetical protein J7384_02865 [Endozoicomonas sp. G2_1]|uniref:hypothetical protein n=1 Tax=Endozoicomonas sp. G2_1 TaxID=2821091 RepID=UPI001ADD1071|nr:hypothetical protein [Endozoicomonas sp. G2_1]MBO9489294.1 hypothetical protein [Endozoicomonas sp. G2_1]
MPTTSTLTKKLIATFLLITSGTAIAAPTDKFTIAVIEGSAGSKLIKSGQLQANVKQLDTLSAEPNKLFEQYMSLCAVNIKVKALDAAKQTCSEAIELSKHVEARDELIAYTYNNLAIAKVLASDHQGAYNDFNSALSFEHNKIINKNLSKLVREHSELSTTETDNLSVAE